MVLSEAFPMQVIAAQITASPLSIHADFPGRAKRAQCKAEAANSRIVASLEVDRL